MPTSIEKMPDAPILIVHTSPSPDIPRETGEAIAMITQALDAQTEKVFLVTDMRDISMGLDDIIRAASLGARGRDTMMHHPNIRENIYILTDGLIKMAARGLDSATFGQVKVRLFDTVEEALDYCRAQLKPPAF